MVTLSYNSLNLPDTLQLKDGHIVSYVYDASGRKEQVNRVTLVYNNTHISSILLPDGIMIRTNALTTNPPVFSYNLNPQFNTGRYDLRVHPDGNNVGTLGCIVYFN